VTTTCSEGSLKKTMHYFRLSQSRRWKLHSSGLLRKE